MMTVVWAGMILISIAYALISGRTQFLTQGIFDGAAKAIELSATMLGVMCFWNGIMTVALRSGVVNLLSKLLRPVMRFLFKKVDEPVAKEAICMNMTANLIGLGNAATPFGLKAMKELSKLNGHSQTASDAMITFVVINTASLQLVPTGLAMLRSQYGSQTPMEILPCVWISSACALAVGIVISKVFSRDKRKDRVRV